MGAWQKMEVLSKIVAALLIPLAIAWLANEVSASNKQRDAEIKFVEIASAVLNREPDLNASIEARSLRVWAVDVLNKYSGVKMSAEAVKALVQSESLPPVVNSAVGAIDPVESRDTWAIVFGGDTTLAAAKNEIDVTAKKMKLTGAAIFRRAGSFRSVKVFFSKSAATEALGTTRAVRDDAYIVNMARWCPTSVQREGYFECIS